MKTKLILLLTLLAVAARTQIFQWPIDTTTVHTAPTTNNYLLTVTNNFPVPTNAVIFNPSAYTVGDSQLAADKKANSNFQAIVTFLETNTPYAGFTNFWLDGVVDGPSSGNDFSLQGANEIIAIVDNEFITNGYFDLTLSNAIAGYTNIIAATNAFLLNGQPAAYYLDTNDTRVAAITVDSSMTATTSAPDARGSVTVALTAVGGGGGGGGSSSNTIASLNGRGTNTTFYSNGGAPSLSDVSGSFTYGYGSLHSYPYRYDYAGGSLYVSNVIARIAAMDSDPSQTWDASNEVTVGNGIFDEDISFAGNGNTNQFSYFFNTNVNLDPMTLYRHLFYDRDTHPRPYTTDDNSDRPASTFSVSISTNYQNIAPRVILYQYQGLPKNSYSVGQSIPTVIQADYIVGSTAMVSTNYGTPPKTSVDPLVSSYLAGCYSITGTNNTTTSFPVGYFFYPSASWYVYQPLFYPPFCYIDGVSYSNDMFGVNGLNPTNYPFSEITYVVTPYYANPFIQSFIASTNVNNPQVVCYKYSLTANINQTNYVYGSLPGYVPLALDNLIQNLKTAGLWTNVFDAIYPFAAGVPACNANNLLATNFPAVLNGQLADSGNNTFSLGVSNTPAGNNIDTGIQPWALGHTNLAVILWMTSGSLTNCQLVNSDDSQFILSFATSTGGTDTFPPYSTSAKTMTMYAGDGTGYYYGTNNYWGTPGLFYPTNVFNRTFVAWSTGNGTDELDMEQGVYGTSAGTMIWTPGLPSAWTSGSGQIHFLASNTYSQSCGFAAVAHDLNSAQLQQIAAIVAQYETEMGR